MNRIYMCIDLKSFYASVECVERGLDPLNTNLVVADNSRTSKTVCLAVTPSLKQYGIGGRARLFEVESKVKELNSKRGNKGSSYFDDELKQNNDLQLDYIVAIPRMKLYMNYSNKIYNIYLKYLSPDDIFVYSIDEVFCDITDYLSYYNLSPEELTTKIIQDVIKETGITATAGIGTNLYLAKIAMDIVAKHAEADSHGVRLASIDVHKYRELLWEHKPLTSFWRVGKGISKRLEQMGLYTMGDIARYSIDNEDKLFKEFGVSAEVLIDHAWGYEETTVKDVKAYKPEHNSISSGQVLHEPYDYLKAKLIIKEMTELLALDLVGKHLVTDQITLTIIYDVSNINNPKINYNGPVTLDMYGRLVPKHSHGTIRIDHKTNSSKVIMSYMLKLIDKIINKDLLVRKLNICFCDVIKEDKVVTKKEVLQLNLFNDVIKEKEVKEKNIIKEQEENVLSHTLLDIKNKYGKNAILKGMNLEQGATTIDRNKQVGGHKG